MVRKLSLVFALALVVLAAPVLRAQTFEVDHVHSSVTFKIRHLVSNVTGRFGDFSGKIMVNKDDMTKSSVEFNIVATSVNTDNENRDEHLRSADFFAVDSFPQLSFKSTKVEKAGENSYKVTGDFTMRGVTKSITVPVEVLGFVTGKRGTTAGFETSFKVNRKDYGINWNRALDQGGFILGDEVQVNINIEAGEKKTEAAEKE